MSQKLSVTINLTPAQVNRALELTPFQLNKIEMEKMTNRNNSFDLNAIKKYVCDCDGFLSSLVLISLCDAIDNDAIRNEDIQRSCDINTDRHNERMLKESIRSIIEDMEKRKNTLIAAYDELTALAKSLGIEDEND